MNIVAFGDFYAIDEAIASLLSARKETNTVNTYQWQQLDSDVTTIFEQFQPDAILLAVLLPINSEFTELAYYQQLVQQTLDWAAQHQTIIMMLSTTAVFDGARIAYYEKDSVSPVNDYGRFYAELEQQLTAYNKSIIVRTGWLYGANERCFLPEVIEYALRGECIRLNSAGKACPTAVDDLARVIVGMLLQIQQGAENWGIFHYVAADTALGFQFVEAILQQTEKFCLDINPKQVCFEHQNTPDVHFYFAPVVLKCTRLLESFGIHQKSWRTMLPSVVRTFFQQS